LGASQQGSPHILAMTLMRGSLEKLLLEDGEYPINFTVKADQNPELAKLSLKNLRDVTWFFVGASAGLVQLHAHNVVHGDVASRNLLLDFNNNCCVCDFGMSHIMPTGQTTVQTTLTDLLPIAWSSPETLEKRLWSDKSDVYSFGITIMEVLSRQEPYHGMDLLRTVAPGVCKAKQPLRPTISEWWPDQLVEIAVDCLEHKAADRPTMMAVNQRLRRYHKKLCSNDNFNEVYIPHAKVSAAGSAVSAESSSAKVAYKRITASNYYLSTQH